MTYEQALEVIKKADNLIYAYALDGTGWFLFILDPHDEEYPPV